MPTASSGSAGDGESAGAKQSGEQPSAEQQGQAGEDLQKAGQRVADAGQRIGTSSSTATSGGGQEEPDPLIPESDSSRESDIAGVNDAAVSTDSSEQTDSRDPQASENSGSTASAGGISEEVEAAQAALEQAGTALQEAGAAVQNAKSPEELERAREALSDARVAVIVAGEDLREAKDSRGGNGAGGEAPWEEAEAALEEANHAIVTASRTVLSDNPEMPGHAGGGTGSDKGQLDQELDESLAIFEGKIQDAREDVLDSAPAPAGQKDPGQETVAIGQPGGEQQSVTGEEDEASSGDDAEEGEQQQTGRMPGPGEVQTAAVQSQPPEDIPDGQDDDIVAQQLREAAMAETDPELKEKLWEEYRRYKEGISK